jgi:cytochrome P450
MAVLIILFTLLVTMFAVQYLMLRFKHKQLYHLGNSLPGPPSLPVLGNILIFIKKNHKDIFELIENWHHEYMDTTMWRIWFGAKLAIFVNDPLVIENILTSTKCLEKPAFYCLEYGLNSLSSQYDIWKKHREFLKQAFSNIGVNGFHTISVESINKLLQMLNNRIDDEEFDMSIYTTRCSLLMLCGLAFGIDETCAELDDLFFKVIGRQNQLVAARYQNPIYLVDPIYRLTRMYRKEKKYQKTIGQYLNEILTERRDIAKSNQLIGEKSHSDVLIDQMIQQQQHIDAFTDQEIMQNVYTTIVSGFENIALQASYIILMLAMHPEIQERTAIEIIELLEISKINDAELLHKSTYLDCVIKETMRLCPVVPFVARKTLEEIQVADIAIPSGVTLLISIYSLHRRKDIWGEKANQFNPDNFLTENIKEKHTYCFLPFSGGQRNCIGDQFSILFLKLMLIKLLRNFKFKTKLKFDEITFKVDTALRIQNDCMVSIEKR